MRPPPSRRLVLCWATALLPAAAALGVPALSAQQPISEFLDTIEVRVVNVDVVVLDRDGRSLPGLTREDFELLEDGKREQVRESARDSEALIYWIRLTEAAKESGHASAWRGAAEHAREIDGLRRVVTASGGRVLEIPRIDDVDAALAEVLAELREQYVLGYYPSRSRGPGAWHDIEVRVGRPGARPRARDGYREGRN